MGKIADRIKEVAPITQPPAYVFLEQAAEELKKALADATRVKDGRCGDMLLKSIRSAVQASWNQALLDAITEYGADETRAALNCLDKRQRLDFLEMPVSPGKLTPIRGGRK